MQKIQPTKRYYKMYKKGRFWVVAGITVMAAGISPMVVHADTADTATTTAITADVDATGKHASSTPVPASAEAQSVAPVSTEQTGSAASTSAANDSSATNVASSAPAPASVTSEAGSQTAGSGAVTSAAPASANEAGSGVPANSTAPSAVDSGTPSSATSAAPSNGSAAPASNAPETTSSAAATESTASKGKLMAKRALRAPAAAVASVDPDEQDLSDQFTDANLLAAVRRGFDLADGASLTMNTIKTYKSSHFEVKAYTVTNGEIEYYPVTNLQGLQVLANLPAETTTAVDIQLGDDSNSVSNFDFSPLESIKIWNLNLYTRYWSFVSDKQLQLIAGLDTSTIHNLEFSSPNKFKKNPDGMTNHQFNILAPFVKAVLENHFPGSQMIGFSGNNITDFSALKSVSPTQSSQVTGLFEWDFRTDKLAYNAGDTVEVESALTGVQGESVNYTVRYYQDNGTAEGELVAADAHEETVTNPDGTTRTVWKYTLVNPLVVNNEIRYGTYYYDDSLWTKYKTDINGNPLSDFGSALGAFTIQPVTSSKATLTFNPSEVVMGPNATWNYLDHVASATDYDGNPISQDKWNTLNITNVNGLPDLTKAGWQTVEFTFTDDKGIVLTATAAVNVLASQASIWAKADQIVWPKEVSDIKASDLVASVTDAYGNPVTDFTTVQMSALDAAKAGAQLVTLTYTDEAGNQVTATLNVTVDLATLATQPVKVVVGPNAKWKYEMNLLGVTDSLGQPLAVDKATIKVVTGPDLTVVKPQTVVLEYTDDLGRTQRFEAQVTTIQSQAAITANDDLIVWPKEVGGLTVAELVRNVTDMNGNAVTDLTNVTMSGVDSTKPGAQPVTLTYTDAAGNQVTTTINVTVDLATLTTKDVQLVAGPTAKWDYKANLESVLDSRGQAIDVTTAKVKVVTGPDLSDAKVGVPQTVVLEYTDDLGRTQHFNATVTTTKTQATITAKDDPIVWPAEVADLTVTDLVHSVTDANGQAVPDLTGVTMSKVDPAKAGVQPITLTYTDAAGNQVTTTINVTVDLASLTTKDVQLVAGPTAKWDYVTNLTGATDSLGQAIDVKTADVKVITGPDLSAALVGQPQTVVLEYTDDLGRTQRFNAVVTTTATQASITAKTDQVVWPGDVKNLTAADLVHNVIDADGQAVTDLSNVTMSGVDATKAGVQTVTLTYTDAAGNRVTTTINVTVDLATLTTKDVQVVAGPTAKWDYLTSLTGATDSLGQVIDVKNARVQVVTAPDLSTALIGQPQTVTFEYTDNLGQTQRVSALVTTMKTQAAIAGRDVTVVAGPNAKWTLTDSLDGSQSLAADGSALSATDLAAVTTNITPNVQKPGTYVLTLSYVDAAGNLVTGTANVNVVASQAALQVQDSQIKVGANWQAADNLLRVVDSTGQPASIEQVTVTGTVDTTKAGIYPVTYKYTDAAGNVLERTANVTVVAEPTDPGNGGGTTDPGNGGGTTDPGNGGGTTDPGNGGGTTDPGNGGGTTDPDNGGGVAAPDNGDTISTQPEPVTPEPVADSSPVATPQPTVKKTTIQADQVRPATAALRSVAAAKTPQSSGLPQTDERRTGMTTMVAGLLGLTGLFSAWGVTKRRQRK